MPKSVTSPQLVTTPPKVMSEPKGKQFWPGGNTHSLVIPTHSLTTVNLVTGCCSARPPAVRAAAPAEADRNWTVPATPPTAAEKVLPGGQLVRNDMELPTSLALTT